MNLEFSQNTQGLISFAICIVDLRVLVRLFLLTSFHGDTCVDFIQPLLRNHGKLLLAPEMLGLRLNPLVVEEFFWYWALT